MRAGRLIIAAALALFMAGCGKTEAPEPVAAAPPAVSTGGTAVPPMEVQRQDKQGN